MVQQIRAETAVDLRVIFMGAGYNPQDRVLEVGQEVDCGGRAVRGIRARVAAAGRVGVRIGDGVRPVRVQMEVSKDAVVVERV